MCRKESGVNNELIEILSRLGNRINNNQQSRKHVRDCLPVQFPYSSPVHCTAVCVITFARRYCDPSCLFVCWFVR